MKDKTVSLQIELIIIAIKESIHRAYLLLADTNSKMVDITKINHR